MDTKVNRGELVLWLFSIVSGVKKKKILQPVTDAFEPSISVLSADALHQNPLHLTFFSYVALFLKILVFLFFKPGLSALIVSCLALRNLSNVGLLLECQCLFCSRISHLLLCRFPAVGYLFGQFSIFFCHPQPLLLRQVLLTMFHPMLSFGPTSPALSSFIFLF